MQHEITDDHSVGDNRSGRVVVSQIDWDGQMYSPHGKNAPNFLFKFSQAETNVVYTAEVKRSYIVETCPITCHQEFAGLFYGPPTIEYISQKNVVVRFSGRGVCGKYHLDVEMERLPTPKSETTVRD